MNAAAAFHTIILVVLHNVKGKILSLSQLQSNNVRYALAVACLNRVVCLFSATKATKI